MTPLDAWVARANVARLRVIIAGCANATDREKLRRLLEQELKKLRAAHERDPDPRA